MIVRSVTVPEDLWGRVEAAAEERGSNHSQVIRELILRHLPGA